MMQHLNVEKKNLVPLLEFLVDKCIFAFSKQCRYCHQPLFGLFGFSLFAPTNKNHFTIATSLTFAHRFN